jgi:hypothetical protein
MADTIGAISAPENMSSLGHMMNDGVDTVSGEFIRILGLILGFTVVNVVLLMAAFHSRHVNVNQLIAFVLVFASATGVVLIAVTPLKMFLAKGNRKMWAAGFMCLVVAALMVFGVLFFKEVISVPLVKVNVATEFEAEKLDVSSFVRMQSSDAQFDTAFLEKTKSMGFKFAVGGTSSRDLQKMLPFIIDNPELIVFSVDSTQPGLNIAPNLFRMMPSDIYTASTIVFALPKTGSVHVFSNKSGPYSTKFTDLLQEQLGARFVLKPLAAEAVDVNIQSTNSTVVVPENSEEAKEFWQNHVVKGGQAVWVTDTSDQIDCAKCMKNMSESGANLLSPFKSAFNPGNLVEDPTLMSTKAALDIIEQTALGAINELRSTTDKINFIRSQNTLQNFNTSGDGEPNNLFQLQATPQGWESSSKVFGVVLKDGKVVSSIGIVL